jgi:Flp pilus assembly protein TadG
VNLLTHRRGSVALMAGLMAPVMVMAVAMGIEVTSWSVTNVDLQRIADVAAWAGAAQYLATKTPQTATSTAADLAEINGVAGTATRTWTSGTSTMSDNMITAQVVNGVRNTADPAIKVTVTQNIPKVFSLIFPVGSSSQPVSATAIAEIVTAGGGGAPACLVALQANATGVTDDITLSGSAALNATNCSVRSNSGIALNGPTTINVDGTYAAGVITVPTWNPGAITGGTFPNSGTIPDPYAGNNAVQTALASLAAGSIPGPVIPDPNTSWKTQTISPGLYSSLTLGGSSNITLSPGTYYVQGNVTFNGAATVNGSNVTIISLGTLTDTASAATTLTSPTTASVQLTPGQGIAGILFASLNSGQSQFSGNVAFPLSGVIYYPNGNIDFSGSVDVSNGASSCGEVIAGTVTITGTSVLGTTGCAQFGVQPIPPQPGVSSVVLVQ